MFYTDNPVRDAERCMAEQDERLEALPVCSECDQHIQDDHLYEINGEYICQSCMDNNHRKWVEDCVS